ncbi:MAG: PhoX family phosphatase [Rhodospirillales bacterium]|nr:PhoX family phosphatase [Rhodospirillales bacterium]
MNGFDSDDLPIARPHGPSLARLNAERMGRREMMTGLLAGTAGAAVAGLAPGALLAATRDSSTLTFRSPKHAIGDDHAVAPGHAGQVLIRWGDPVLAGAPAFDVTKQDAAAQGAQFGYNNDFMAFMPLPRGSNASDHGLLCVSHEYTMAELMWPGLTVQTRAEKVTRAQADVEIAAHGHSILEIKKSGAAWAVVPGSRFARRLTGGTEMRLSGPAAGHARLKTKADPSGTKVLGTFNNCAGGVTPWGTVLIAEENINTYFGGEPAMTDEAANHKRMGLSACSRYGWWRHHDRFNVEKEPGEPNRFGWIVEFDPYDPNSVPVKRTALGRFKHEGATCAVLRDGRVVVYSGDDQAGEYLYRFVSEGRFDSANPAGVRDLLDKGTLSVAKFKAGGTMEWRPLVFGQGPLTAANGFAGPADVLIETRRAADLVGATPMDRPEDVEPSPRSGRVYVALTGNSTRKADATDAANPRGPNAFGHIVELIPPGAETEGATAADARHDAERFRWNVLLMAGDPKNPAHGAQYHARQAEEGVWLASPDNVAFDEKGRLWISTDQGSAQAKNNIPDGMYACDLEGPGRGLVKFFYGCPRGAEMCGPAFTPDNRTLFVAVQHPGEGSTYDAPSTRWPDFKAGVPPRPAVVALTRKDNGKIGS